MSPVLYWEPLKGQERRGKITITKSVLNINRELVCDAVNPTPFTNTVSTIH